MLPEAAALAFMGIGAVSIAGIACIVSRSGYAGEDGFEIGCEAGEGEAVAQALLARGAVPAGLGARDSLRLEAGLCLYGHELDETTNPVAANLAWTIGKRRKLAWDFLGAAPVRAALEEGPAERLVGLAVEGRAPVRAGTEICRRGDAVIIGRVTSGTFGPSLQAPVAMGYVRADAAAAGTKLDFILRGKPVAGTVAPMPFIPHRYAR